MATKTEIPAPTLRQQVEAEIDTFWRETDVRMDPTTWNHLVARREALKERLAPLFKE
jgi:hypothetical protein